MPRLSKLDASNSDEVCFMRAVSVGADVDFVGCEVAGSFSPGGSCLLFVCNVARSRRSGFSFSAISSSSSSISRMEPSCTFQRLDGCCDNDRAENCVDRSFGLGSLLTFGDMIGSSCALVSILLLSSSSSIFKTESSCRFQKLDGCCDRDRGERSRVGVRGLLSNRCKKSKYNQNRRRDNHSNGPEQLTVCNANPMRVRAVAGAHFHAMQQPHQFKSM
jgi:hypothetical protein